MRVRRIDEPSPFSPFKILHTAGLTFDQEGKAFEGDDPRSRLMAIVQLGGTHFHLEAIEVRETDNCLQEAANSAFDETLSAMHTINGDDRFETVEIEGRTYVLNMIPFGK